MNEKTIPEYIALAEHYIAIGSSDIYLYRDTDIPKEVWDLASSADSGGTWRLNGPSSVRFSAPHPCGLTFSWSVDFEGRDANGSGVHQFDRERLREVMLMLPKDGAKSFASMLESQVLPPLKQRSKELSEAMNKQMDSYSAALSLVEWAKEMAE